MNDTISRTGDAMRRIALALGVALALGGCAGTQMRQIAPKMSNMVIARHYFGEPARSEELPDGTMRHEWLLDRVFNHPGGMETRNVYVGHDRDGYREYVEEEVYVSPWQEQQYCRMEVIADREGRIFNVSWEGRNCDELPRVKVPAY